MRGMFGRLESMDFPSARQLVLNVLRGVCAADLPRLLHWMRTSMIVLTLLIPLCQDVETVLFSNTCKAGNRYIASILSLKTDDFDEFTSNNDDIIVRSIAEDLRDRLPEEAMLSSEHFALQKLQQQTKPTVHIDAFLYDDDCIDSLCEEGKMSRYYCLMCGSHRTAPLEFVSHSFSIMELKFLFQHVLPDLTGKVVVDIGSRLGAVLFGGYFYSSASQIYGVEMNADFCQLQEDIIAKYQLHGRIKVLHADICTQASLLQNADVVVMNNVFEYFLDSSEQARCWKFIRQNVRKRGSLLVTLPSLEKSLSELQVDIQLSQWVEALPLDYDVFLEEAADREALEQIHLYRIL